MDLFAYPVLRGFLAAFGTKPIMAGKSHLFAMGAFRIRAFIAAKTSQGTAAT